MSRYALLTICACVLFLALLPLLSGCGDSSGPSASGIDIVTTTGMVGDIAKNVVGDKRQVTAIIGQTDPHEYAPTRDDVKKLLDAKIVFYSGLFLEGRMTDTFEKVKEEGKAIFPVADSLPKDYLRQPPEFEGHPDPHVWMDVSAWSKCVGFIAEKMSAEDKANAAEFKKNAEAYQKELEGLDAYIKKVIGSIPKDKRLLVTAHDAFGYFGRAYGIEVHAAQGIDTTVEASVADINRLVDFVVNNNVDIVFFETSVNPANLKAVIEGAASQGKKIRTIDAKLLSDEMGDPGTYEGTYIGMMDHNATTIARALGGEAPEKGFRGKLSSVAVGPGE